MTIKKSPSLLGGAMIIAGTAIGAGMLANPTSTAGVWFIGSILALVYTWFCMTTSGLMILEANLHYPTGSSFDTIVNQWSFSCFCVVYFDLCLHHFRRWYYTKLA